MEEEGQEQHDDGSCAFTKIYVTGHSKGGSLASLFALMVHHDEELTSPELVCTFGAARVGNEAFVSYYERFLNQITYENDLDIISFLPPGKDTKEVIDNVTEYAEESVAMTKMIERYVRPTNRNDE
jgi:hypothetical protein